MGLKNRSKIDTNRVELEVEVGAEPFEEAVKRAYKRNVGRFTIPGFRKGKAPRQLIERMYGPEIFYEDAIDDVYPSALSEAIEESGYEYVEDKIDFDIVSVGKEGLIFKAAITVKPEVEIGSYKGLKAEKKIKPVTDEDVDAEIKKLQQRGSRLLTVEDRPVGNDDIVNLDFEGFVDGQPFEGGKVEGFTLKIGSNHFIPGFEEQLIGKNKGEEFEVNVTFPDDYHEDSLKGKPAVFKCKINEIRMTELPEVNDEFAKDVSEFDTLEELKADIRAKLEHQREHEAEDAFETQLLDQLAEGVKGEIPQAMFENRIDESVSGFEQRLRAQGLNLESYLDYTGTDMESFRNSFREQAEKQVKVRLALEKIVKLENIDVSSEELEAEYSKYAELYKTDVEKVKMMISEKELSKDLAVNKAFELIKENAKVSA